MKHKVAQGQKQIQPAEHIQPARFGDSPAKQGRTGVTSVLVWFFWNFGFEILKY